MGSKTMLDLAEWDWTLPDLPVDSWWFFTIVLVLLVLFIWTVARLTTRTTDDIDPAEIDRQMLSAVSELRSQGEITQEEFRSIKSRLVSNLAPSGTSAQTESESNNSALSEQVSKDPTLESEPSLSSPDSENEPTMDKDPDPDNQTNIA